MGRKNDKQPGCTVILRATKDEAMSTICTPNRVRQEEISTPTTPIL